MTTRFLFCWVAAAAVLHGVPLRAADVPFGGNSFLTAGEGGRRRGADAWSQSDRIVSVFFRVDRAADLELALKGSVPDGESRIRATAEGQIFTAALKGSGIFPLGPLRVEKAGYVRVDLQGMERSGPVFAELSDLVVTTKTEGTQF
ncbi:MAG: DUF5077 domain-containing protein, partial [Verrucomicrobiota bacterium]